MSSHEEKAGGTRLSTDNQSLPPSPARDVEKDAAVLRESIASVPTGAPNPNTQHESTSPSPEPDIERPLTGPPAGPPFQKEALENYRPGTLRFWLVLLSVYLSVFTVALDRTILSTAVPRITDEFHSLGDIGWYGSSYMLVTAAFQLVFGRIYRFYDLRNVFLGSIVLFEVGSAICGAAPSSAVFILGRSIAGLGSAGVMTGSMIVIIFNVPLQKRPMFQSVYGIIFGVSSAIGPLLGGAFTETATWRWCFYMNLPIGAVTLVCLFSFLKSPKKPPMPASLKEHIMRLDPLGTLFFVPAMVCLIMALKWGGSVHEWSNWRVIVLLVVSGLTAVGFIVVQVMMPKSASLPVRVIKQRSMLAGTWFLIMLSGAMFLCIYYMPLWFQAVYGVEPIQSGINTLPLVLSLAVSAVGSSAIIQAVGYYVPSMILCPVLMVVGEGLLTTLTPTTSSSQWIAFQFLVGFGIGFGMQTVNLAVQNTLPKEDIPTGIAITFWALQFGGAIFVSVGQNILNGVLAARLGDVPGLELKTIVETGATNIHEMVAPEKLGVVVEAFNFACTRIFIVATVLSVLQVLCACCMEWKSIKSKTGPPGPPGPVMTQPK